MPTARKTLHLKIVFDTNVIYNSSSSDLLTSEIKELIEKHSNPTDIKISWHLPEIVLNERRFQMQKRGAELFPSLGKLENLLGHNLGITKELIIARINEAITKNVINYKLEILKLVIEEVQWEDIIKCASYRLPPFEDGNKEKGFRDALILESMMQLISKSPTSLSHCRVILITNDKLLSEATVSKTSQKLNVSVLSSIEELESLINILDSQIKEELINSISLQASELFFLSGNETTIYYKENLRGKIKSQFANEFNKLPGSADRREEIQWIISKPGFVKKERQRIFWKTTITIDSKASALKLLYSQTILHEGLTGFSSENPNGIVGLTGLSGLTGLVGTYQPSNLFINRNKNQITDPIQTSQEVISTGKSKFEVIWSVTLTTKKTLISPKIESINFIETIWT